MVMKITDIFQRRPAVPNSAYQPPQPDTGLDRKLAPTLQQRLADLREMVGNTGDLIVNELTVCGIDCAVVMCEGMVATAVRIIISLVLIVQGRWPGGQRGSLSTPLNLCWIIFYLCDAIFS